MGLNKIERITRVLAETPPIREGWDSVELVGGPFDGCWMHVDLETEHMLLAANHQVSTFALYFMSARQTDEVGVWELYGRFSRYVKDCDPLVKASEGFE